MKTDAAARRERRIERVADGQVEPSHPFLAKDHPRGIADLHFHLFSDRAAGMRGIDFLSGLGGAF